MSVRQFMLCILDRDEDKQSSWPNVDVGATVFSFPSNEISI